MSTLLLTGGNRGIGFEAAVLFAKTEKFSKIILTVRSTDKGPPTITAVAGKSGKPESMFAFQVLDLTSSKSVTAAVAELPSGIDAMVLNAGGLGAETLTAEGVSENFAMNVLGNVGLVEGLIGAGKIKVSSARDPGKNPRIIYSHSETTRSVWGFAGFQPWVRIAKESIEDSMANPPPAGTLGMGVRQRMNTYGNSKLIGGLCISTLAKEHDDIYFASVSPGGCADTNVYQEAPWPMPFLMGLGAAKHMMEGMGLCHPVEGAAKRYVAAVCDESFPERFPSGAVVGGPYYQICSKDGTLVDQSEFAPYYTDTDLQQEAARVVRAKLKSCQDAK